MTREEIDEYICKCPYFSGAKCIDRSILGTHIGSCSLEFHHKKICPSSECICAGKFGLDRKARNDMTREEALVQLRLGPGINEDVSEEYNEAVDMAIEVLEQQPNEDCISRQLMYDMGATCIAARNKDGNLVALGALDILPSATPQPKEEPQQKTGHWIYSKAVNTGEIIWSKCSKCGNEERGCAQRMKYCPECGIKMQEEEQ